MAISDAPLSGSPSGDINRIRRITFLIGPSKTAAHLDNHSSGSQPAYAKVRNDSTDPANIHVTERDTYIDEEA